MRRRGDGLKHFHSACMAKGHALQKICSNWFNSKAKAKNEDCQGQPLTVVETARINPGA